MVYASGLCGEISIIYAESELFAGVGISVGRSSVSRRLAKSSPSSWRMSKFRYFPTRG